MILINGYRFPPGLLYDVPRHTWYRPEPDGTITLGMTEIATLLSGPILAYTPRRVGLPLEAGRSCAVIESGKWVGPVRIAFDGTVVEINEPLITSPHRANQDPYGTGWILRARPDTADALTGLVSGNALEAAYRAWMDAENFPPGAG